MNNINIDDEDPFDVDSHGTGRYRRLGEPETLYERFLRALRPITTHFNHVHWSVLAKMLIAVLTLILLFTVLFSGLKNPKKGESKPSVPHQEPPPPQVDPQFSTLTLDGMFSGDYFVHNQQLKFIDVVIPKEPANGNKRDGDNQEEKEPQTEQTTKSSDEPGYYIQMEGASVYIHQASNPDFKLLLVDLSTLTYEDKPLNPTSFVDVTKDLSKILVVSNVQPQWRHSSLGQYWIVDRATMKVEPLAIDDTHKDSDEEHKHAHELIYYAQFTPSGQAVYFNFKGNIFIKFLKDGNIKQITKDGDNINIFNGKSDWVYEEEVLATDKAIWCSPDGSKLAFVKFDDSKVPVYNLEFFKYDKYPQVDKLKYPKPGFPNPIISMHVYDIEKREIVDVIQPKGNSLGDDFIVYQAAWYSNDQLLFKTTDRTSRKIHLNVFDFPSGASTIVRETDTNSYKGWYKNNGPLYILPNNLGYIDSIVYEGYDHLAYYASIESNVEPTMLSSGNWDVMDGVVGFDGEDIYFIGTSGNALQRQIYKSNLETSTLTALTQLDLIHAYSLELSKNAHWAVIKYLGPGLPSQKLVSLEQYISNSDYYNQLPELSNSKEVDERFSHLAVPAKEYIKLPIGDGIVLDALIVKPHDFSSKKSYPLLVSIYGGPGSQKLSCEFTYGFEEIVSSSLDAIVLYIDPRGTSGRGWGYQSWARDHIGYWEPRDITAATEMFANDNLFVDVNRIAVWGWSYGGFATLKTLEYDAGRVFKYGMAVAPVTNWALYDSIYTERYMGSPTDNADGYNDAKVSQFKNFKNLNRFLVIHGSADDNVHLQNTYQLINSFDLNGVQNYDMHVYPDSDHSIHYDNANPMVYGRLFDWLERVWY